MTVVSLETDRRRRRSSHTFTALTYQLEHIYEREGLRSFTLVDAKGLPIAFAGHPQEADVLAAYAPVLARRMDRSRREAVLSKVRQFIPDATVETLQVRAFQIDGEELFLCLLSEPGVHQHVGMYRAITGVRRIIDQANRAA